MSSGRGRRPLPGLSGSSSGALSVSLSLLVRIYFLQLRGLVWPLGNAQQMSRLKSELPTPCSRGPGGAGSPVLGAAAVFEDSVCSSLDKRMKYVLSHIRFMKVFLSGDVFVFHNLGSFFFFL